MLVLTRKLGEEIVIDGHIRVTIVAAKGDRVRVGVTAPAGVRIDRDEVHRRVREFSDDGSVANRFDFDIPVGCEAGG
jgi:carbon storage regulator